MKTTIKTLYQKGYNKTQIAKTLGIDRKTVRKILKSSEEMEVTESKEKRLILLCLMIIRNLLKFR